MIAPLIRRGPRKVLPTVGDFVRMDKWGSPVFGYVYLICPHFPDPVCVYLWSGRGDRPKYPNGKVVWVNWPEVELAPLPPPFIRRTR